MAQKIIERVEAHYEAREVPFGKVYEWHPAYLSLECGEQSILGATSTMTTCSRCGADLDVDGLVHDIQERDGPMPDRLTHPWSYDVQVQAEQRLRDEAAYSEGSPWRYNDVTTEDDG